jgi:hypothetical protein
LDVADYKEHAIGGGRDVKAATYIECTATSSHEKVWGVGIHEDVVQASLIALLSAASSVSGDFSPTGLPLVHSASWFSELSPVGNTNGPHLLQFLTSRVSTPRPFKPKHVRQFSDAEVEALERLNLNSPPHINGSLLSSPKALTPRDPVVSAKAVNQAKFQKVDIAKLEAQVEN